MSEISREHSDHDPAELAANPPRAVTEGPIVPLAEAAILEEDLTPDPEAPIGPGLPGLPFP